MREYLQFMMKRHGAAQLARKLGISRARLYQIRDSGRIPHERCRALRDALLHLELCEPRGQRVRPLALCEMRPDVWSEPDQVDVEVRSQFGGEREYSSRTVIGIGERKQGAPSVSGR